VRDDVCASGVAKLRALTALREATVNGQAEQLVSLRRGDRSGAARRRAAVDVRERRQPDRRRLDRRLLRPERTGRARSLASDPSVLTALANDVGFERVFARQIAAFARAGDVALGISTSGSSENVVAGIAEAKRRGLVTIGLVGGDGGRLARASDVDFLLVVPSDSVHRIQEVQATLYHLLQELACAS
jgi:D-sedoheptulose 7-phosphate isomerase